MSITAERLLSEIQALPATEKEELIRHVLEFDDAQSRSGSELTGAEYVEAEYGLTPDEWKTVAEKLHQEGLHASESGASKRFTGDIEDALQD